MQLELQAYAISTNFAPRCNDGGKIVTIRNQLRNTAVD